MITHEQERHAFRHWRVRKTILERVAPGTKVTGPAWSDSASKAMSVLGTTVVVVTLLT
jgi:hypothetical protein